MAGLSGSIHDKQLSDEKAKQEELAQWKKDQLKQLKKSRKELKKK